MAIAYCDSGIIKEKTGFIVLDRGVICVYEIMKSFWKNDPIWRYE